MAEAKAKLTLCCCKGRAGFRAAAEVVVSSRERGKTKVLLAEKLDIAKVEITGEKTRLNQSGRLG